MSQMEHGYETGKKPMDVRQGEGRAEKGHTRQENSGTGAMDLEGFVRRLEETEEKRMFYAKRQLYLSAVAAASCFFLFCVVTAACLSVLPRVHSSLDTIETVAADLQVVSDQLSRADLETLVEHVDQMAVTSEEGIREALLKIQAINIEELNQAIKGLSDVVSPLARLVSRFN